MKRDVEVYDVVGDRGLISDFTGTVLSNFDTTPFEVKGRTVHSVEHAFQASKAVGQPHVRDMILDALTPAHAKHLGQRVKLPEDWEERKLRVMRYLLECKFAQPGPLADALMLTAPKHLIEGNTWGDTFWGCVRQPHDKGIWVGRNQLGIMLMERRRELQNGIPF